MSLLETLIEIFRNQLLAPLIRQIYQLVSTPNQDTIGNRKRRCRLGHAVRSSEYANIFHSRFRFLRIQTVKYPYQLPGSCGRVLDFV